MVPIRGYADTRVAVLGLKGPGLAAAHALEAGGAAVTVWDEDGPARFNAHARGLTVEDLTERDWGDLAALVVENAALLAADEPPRLIALARSIGAPLVGARALLCEAAAQEPSVRLALVTGRHAPAAAETALHLLDAAGLDARPLEASDAARPGGVVIAALQAGDLAHLSDRFTVPALAALSPAPGDDPEILARLAKGAREVLIASADDRACARMIAARRAPGITAVSGRQVLGGGVYVTAGVLFDASAGKPRKISDLGPCAPGEAIAAGYGLARELGAPFEVCAQALKAWPGAPGHGRCVLELGGVRVIDWSAARTAAGALDAVSGREPVVWVAGPGLPGHAGDLLDEASASVRGVHLVTDRCKAARRISKSAACAVHRDLHSALARAVHDALRSGLDRCAVVYAPGSVSAHTGLMLEQTADALMARALKGDAA